MPFIVRASYKGKTCSWPQSGDQFPSYQSLSDQIHKTFRNVDSFHLSRVSFSPSAGAGLPAQFMLIASEIRSDDDWTNTAAAPFLGTSYPSGMLKFLVNDNLTHKETPARGGPWGAGTMEVDAELPRFPVPPPFFTHPGPPTLPTMPTNLPAPPSLVPGVPPPPPFIPPPPPFVPPFMRSTAPPPPPAPPMPPRPESSASSCCNVDTAKSEVKVMMESFLKDFQRTLSDNFGDDIAESTAMDTSATPERTPQAPNRPLSPLGTIPGAFSNSPAPPTSVMHPGIICDLCDEALRGIRYKCNECADFDICEACMGEDENGKFIHTVQTDQEHTFKMIPKPVSSNADTPLPVHRAFCDVCRKTIVGSRHKCLDCPDFDLCDACIVTQRNKHDENHQFYEFKEPGRIVIHNVDRPFPHSSPPQRGGHGHHRGGAPFMRGGRRPYSMRGRPAEEEGTGALNSGADVGRRHTWHRAAGHMHRPGRESGGRQRSPVDLTIPPRGQPATNLTPAAPSGRLAEHHATCDLCDSKILGVRYKCLMCPDYDICSGCFTIAPEQHPRHGFVLIRDPKDVLARSHHYANRTMHHARCDSCNKQIVGARFKCLHRDCPDYDLCENCEALPIEVHPSSHVMVKMKQPTSFYEGLSGLFDFAQGRQPVARGIWQPTVLNLAGEASGEGKMEETTGGYAIKTPVPSVITSPVSPTPLGDAPSQVIHAPVCGRAWQPPHIIRIGPPPMAIPTQIPEVIKIGPPPVTIVSSQPQVVRFSSPQPFIEQTTVAVPQPIIVVPAPQVEAPLPSALNPWWNEETDGRQDLIVLEGEGEKEQQPLPSPSPAAVPEGQLVELTKAMTIEAPEASVFNTPATSESLLEDEEKEVEAVVSPFADVHAVQSQNGDTASVVSVPASVAPSVVSLASTRSSRPSATFVADNTIPDGHVLPVGAYFVKSWKLFNDGEVPWPARTRLAFTGGERLGTSEGDDLVVGGLTQPGETADVRVEFRAPATPGHYSSYWRLQDEEGMMFGHRIWCDVQVVQPESEMALLPELSGTKSSDEAGSLSSSSIVVMPTSAPESVSVAPSPVHQEVFATPTPTISSFGGSEIDPDEVFSEVAESEDMWEDAQRPESPDQFVMVYESSEAASDSDEN